MRYRAVISYFGANYVGWQRQLNGLSVQEMLEKALTKTFGVPTSVIASGRTDAGVHAEGQVVHFDADTTIPTDKIPFAVNTKLPRDISMLFCEVVADDFNARFNAKCKTYCYKMYLAKHKRPMLEQTHAHIVVPLDIDAMQEAAKVIEGEHDFKCFEASGSVVKNTVRTVYSIEITNTPFSHVCNAENSQGVLNGMVLKAESIKNTCTNLLKSGNIFDTELSIYVTGNGFLYNMVRIIAGTLLYVGMHKLSVSDVENLLKIGDRKNAGKTLPAEGLHLISVVY